MLRAIRAINPRHLNWEAIRDQEVRQAQLRAEIELRRLEEERKLLESRKGQVKVELERMGEPEAKVRAHRTLARWWGGLFVLAGVVLVLTAWWSVNWYLSLTWEKALLAASLFVLPLIGWAAFLLAAGERARSLHSWKLFCGLGLVIIICSVGAGVLLGAGRMAGTTLEEETRQAATNIASDDLTARSDSSSSLTRVTWVKKLLAMSTVIAIVLLGVAGEVAAGIAFHEYLKRMTVVWTVEPYYREREELDGRLAENARRYEEARRWPELRDAELTVQGLRQEADTVRQAEQLDREREEAERRDTSLARLVTKVVIFMAVSLALLFGVVVLAFGGQETSGTTVVILDLSTSTDEAAFAKNLQAVEGVVARIPAGGSRLVVLGITEASFGTRTLLIVTSPQTVGRFGEHLESWRQAAIRDWRKTAAGLKPAAKGSDLFGALSRAAVEFDDSRGATKRLIVLSDMRHVGRGLNFERAMPDPTGLLEKVERESLVAKLKGVAVWALGAETSGLDERHWTRLKAFWTGYFKRSGADLKLFSPNRRLGAS